MAPQAMTLIELAAVIAIISVLAIAAYPVFTVRPGDPGAAAGLALEDIRSTQRQAMADGAPRSIVFTAGSPVYTYGREPGSAAPLVRDAGEAAPGAVFQEPLTITFNSLGEPAGLVEPLTVTLSHGAERAAITIHPYTGYAVRGTP